MHCSLVRLQAVWSRSSRHLHHALIPPSRIAGRPSPSPEDHMLPVDMSVSARDDGCSRLLIAAPTRQPLVTTRSAAPA